MLATVLPLSLLALSSVVQAAPLVKKGLDRVIDNCYHDFAYTWDDGVFVYNNIVTSIFQQKQSHTTFFANGNNWSCIYSANNVANLKAAYEAGHQIAHHTWSHAHLTQLTHAEIDVEIERLNDAFVKILGVKPKFLRPPYGEINDDVADYLATRWGLTVVTWSNDSLDSDGQDSTEHNYNYYVDLANNWDGTPVMSLSHETVYGSIQALEQGTVTALKNKGINLLTVAECLDMPAYETVTGHYGIRDSTWTCDGDYVPSNPTSTSSSVSTSTTSASQSCATTYSSSTATTCDAVGALYGISGAAVQAANSFVNCADIWAWTPLCIPTIGTPTSSSVATSTTSASQSCVTTYSSSTATTCDAVGALYGISGAAVQAANSFVNCADIWAWTPLCIPSIGTPTSTSTSTSTSSTPAPSCVQTYSAVAGDTCDKIGNHFGLSGSAILAANSFLNCNDIWAWTPICIPAGGSSTPSTTTSSSSTSSSAPAPSCVSTYTAAAGDSCTTIGAKYGLTAAAIQSANTFLNCSDIWAYTPVCIPPGGTQQCSVQYYTKAGDNCDNIGAMYGVSGAQILSWNDYLTCSDIWAGTPIKICS